MNENQYSEFSNCHPLVIALFFAIAVCVVMFCASPVVLSVSFVCTLFSTTFFTGWHTFFSRFGGAVAVIAFLSFLNGFFSHDGETVLFYINSNRITVEGFLFGVQMGLLFCTVVFLMQTLSVFLTQDKIVYLFGRISPVFGLLLSMAFRLIPQLKHRFSEIHCGQLCMGKHISKHPIALLRLYVKEFSILVAWSLESSIETSDSMAARGYGLHHRTSFHLFRFSFCDKLLLFVLGVCGIGFVIFLCFFPLTFYFYPTVRFASPAVLHWIFTLLFGAFLLIPILIDCLGEQKWKQFNSTT